MSSLSKHFPKHLDVRFLEDGKFMLREDFEYHSNIPGVKVIEVKKGFVSDGATIPRPFRMIIGPPWGGKYPKATVIHDLICVEKLLSRKLSSEIFLEGLRVLGVPLWKRRLMYRGVQAFQFFNWKRAVALLLISLIPLLSGCIAYQSENWIDLSAKDLKAVVKMIPGELEEGKGYGYRKMTFFLGMKNPFLESAK